MAEESKFNFLEKLCFGATFLGGIESMASLSVAVYGATNKIPELVNSGVKYSIPGLVVATVAFSGFVLYDLGRSQGKHQTTSQIKS